MAYSTINVGKFVVALFVVSIPIFLLDEYDEIGMAWAYVGIVILGFATANQSGLTQFTDWVNSKL